VFDASIDRACQLKFIWRGIQLIWTRKRMAGPRPAPKTKQIGPSGAKTRGSENKNKAETRGSELRKCKTCKVVLIGLKQWNLKRFGKPGPMYLPTYIDTCTPTPGPNPTTSIYNTTGSLARFENKNILFYFEKRSNLYMYYNAGVVVVNSKVVRLAPGINRESTYVHK
jgi:hypothetical protein